MPREQGGKLQLVSDRSMPEAPLGRSATRLNVQNSVTTWGDAVVELEWSVDTDDNTEHWASFNPTITFSSSNPSQQRIPVAGVDKVRLKTTTADSTASTDARYFMMAF